MDTLRRMLTPGELDTMGQDAHAVQYRRAPAPSENYGNLAMFSDALNGRYGQATGLGDFVRKAQLAQYETVRAQFEAFDRNLTDAVNPSTGVVYWMLNSPWTSLHWQLFDRYFDQGGAYFGAKKANEDLHLQYSYDDRSVVVVNRRSRRGQPAHRSRRGADRTHRPLQHRRHDRGHRPPHQHRHRQHPRPAHRRPPGGRAEQAAAAGDLVRQPGQPLARRIHHPDRHRPHRRPRRRPHLRISGWNTDTAIQAVATS